MMKKCQNFLTGNSGDLNFFSAPADLPKVCGFVELKNGFLSPFSRQILQISFWKIPGPQPPAKHVPDGKIGGRHGNT